MNSRPTQWVFAILAAAIAIGQACQRPSSQDSSAPPPAGRASIDEKMFVPIGGIEQWITIRGHDRSNPVVFNLHGGPGATASPFAD